MSRHHCNNTNDNQWAHCAVCGGRIHLDECTTKKKPGVDCPGQQYHTPEEMEAAGYGLAKQFAPALVCDWLVRKQVGDHYVFVPCGRPGIKCETGPEFQVGHVRCKRHTKVKL